MSAGTYQRPPDPLLPDMDMGECQHFDCARAATDERNGWRWCLGHFFQTLQWEQARVEVDAA